MEQMWKEERKQMWALGKIKSKMVANPPPPSRKPPLPPRTPLHHLKMSQRNQANPEMEEKNVPQEEVVVEDQVEPQKKEMLVLLQDFQAHPPGETGTAPLREGVAPPTTMESPPKAAESVVDEEESFLGVVEVTVEPTQPLLRLVAAVGEGWGAEVAETTARLLPAATTTSPRGMEAAADMVRIGPSIIQPGPGTGVKLGVRALSMRRSLREGERGAQRLAVRVVQVTWATQTRMTTRNPTPKMALITPTPLVVAPCHLHHPEVPRPESSPQGVCPRGGAGAEAVEEETSTGVVLMLEVHLEDTEVDLAQPLMVAPRSHQLQVESSKARHRVGLKTWAGEELVVRRKIKQLMQVSLKIRGPVPLSHLCRPQLLLLWVQLKTEVLCPSKLQRTLRQTPEGPTHSHSPLTVGSLPVDLNDHPDVAVMDVPSISRTSRPAFGG